MRTGAKASLVTIMKEETKVASISEQPIDDRKTAVVVDAMCDIGHWSFQKGESFGTIEE